MISRRRIPLLIGLFLALVFLIIYIGHLWQEWAPKIARQPLLAPKVSEPVAGDFPAFWTASYLALSGDPAAVYDPQKWGQAEKEMTGTGPHLWLYPPTGLLMLLPLALMPYFVSLGCWLALTLTGYLLVIRRIAQNSFILLWGLTFFGAFENFYFGQNGFLSATLLGGGLLLLDGSPFLGGAILGLLCYKPQMAVLIPLALLAGRRWRSLGGAVASCGSMALASLLIFGGETWSAFFHSIPLTLDNLATHSSWFYKMPTIFAAARLAGFDPKVAWLLHGLGMLAAVGAIVLVWYRENSMAIRASALVLGVLIFTPHLWYYDLPLLAIPLAWLYREGQTKGWLPGEQLLLLAAWLLPLINFTLALEYKWSLGPAYLVAPLILVLRRYVHEVQGRSSRVVAGRRMGYFEKLGWWTVRGPHSQ